MKFTAKTIKRLMVGIALGAMIFAGTGATASAQDRHDPYYGNGGQHGGNRRGGILGGIFGSNNRRRSSDRRHRRDDRRDRRHDRNDRRNNGGYYGKGGYYGNNGHRNDRYNDAYYGNRRHNSRSHDYDRH